MFLLNLFAQQLGRSGNSNGCLTCWRQTGQDTKWISYHNTAAATAAAAAAAAGAATLLFGRNEGPHFKY